MAARWTAFALWAAVAASGVYWALKLFVPGVAMPAHTVLASADATPRGDIARLFGSAAAPVLTEAAADPRFHLLGVVTPHGAGTAGEGLALIAVDEKPPRAFRVGAVVDGDTVLQEVKARGVALGPRGGPARVSLDMPPPAPAATGTLPAAAGGLQPAARAPAFSPARALPAPPAQAAAAVQRLPRPTAKAPAPEPEPAPNGALPTQ